MDRIVRIWSFEFWSFDIVSNFGFRDSDFVRINKYKFAGPILGPSSYHQFYWWWLMKALKKPERQKPFGQGPRSVGDVEIHAIFAGARGGARTPTGFPTGS